jgi:hypothetical protein
MQWERGAFFFPSRTQLVISAQAEADVWQTARYHSYTTAPISCEAREPLHYEEKNDSLRLSATSVRNRAAGRHLLSVPS